MTGVAWMRRHVAVRGNIKLSALMQRRQRNYLIRIYHETLSNVPLHKAVADTDSHYRICVPHVFDGIGFRLAGA